MSIYLNHKYNTHPTHISKKEYNFITFPSIMYLCPYFFFSGDGVGQFPGPTQEVL